MMKTAKMLCAFAALAMLAAVSLFAQTAAVTYGSFTVGGSSSSFYPVQFISQQYQYSNPSAGVNNSNELVIYRSNVHEDGTWYGTFSLSVFFHPTDYGHIYGQIERVIYQTGRSENGNQWNDPVGDLADGSVSSGGNDLIVWLRGGATYHWRNTQSTAGWSLGNGNSAGGSIVNSGGVTMNPITTQSTLILNAKNKFYTNAIGLGTAGSLAVGGSIGIGTSNPGAPLAVSNYLMNGLGTNQTISAAFWTGADINLVIGGDLNGSSTPYLQTTSGGSANVIGSGRYNLAFNPYGGNVGIGTTAPGAKLEVNGGIRLTSGSGGGIIFADGSVQTVAYPGPVSCGGDYAETMNASGERTSYAPGDVLVLDPRNPGKIQKSDIAYSTFVAGIYSTKPGYIGRRQSEPKSADEVPMAMIGVVPAKVSAENGSVHVGDLLVTSSTPGYAMKGTDREKMLGAVIGKAMGTLESGSGIIEVLVTLQ